LIVEYLDRSNFLIEEQMTECKIRSKIVECSKIFRRALTFIGKTSGYCYTFNQESFHGIFDENISHDFDSYGRDEKFNSQWTLDEGYKTQEKSAYPYRASEMSELWLTLKISDADASTHILDKKEFLFF
jgi:hypothetical protein